MSTETATPAATKTTARRAPWNRTDLEEPAHDRRSRAPGIERGQDPGHGASLRSLRTDLNIVEGDLPPQHATIVPGHQIVGVVAGRRAGRRDEDRTPGRISWLGGTDGTCRFCREGRENLCDHPVYTGYDVDGGLRKRRRRASRLCLSSKRSSRRSASRSALVCRHHRLSRAARRRRSTRRKRRTLRLRLVGASCTSDSQTLGLQRVRRFTRQEPRTTAEAMGADWVGKENAAAGSAGSRRHVCPVARSS